MPEARLVSHYMVRNPLCALPWQPVSFVRQQMLEYSYSYLPIRMSKMGSGDGGEFEWKILSDRNVAFYVQDVLSDGRKARLVKSVKEAIDGGLIAVCAVTCKPDELVSKISRDVHEHGVLLIVGDDEADLLGIVTSFDLL
jgi:CBS domain-containing protein